MQIRCRVKPMRMHCSYACCLLLLSGYAATGTASEMFIKPESFEQLPNSAQTAYLFNGTIDRSSYSTDFERVADLSIVTSTGRVSPLQEQWQVQDRLSAFDYEATKPGTYVIGLSTHPRTIEMSSEEFAAYLAHEGLDDDLADFKANWQDSSVRERYVKHSKAILQVGESFSDEYQSHLQHKLEIVPDENPYQLRFGNEMTVQVLIDGRPAANRVARAGAEDFHGHDVSGGHLKYYTLHTDEDGRATFLISQKGTWYVSAIHLEPSTDSDVDYESNWATLTFAVD